MKYYLILDTNSSAIYAITKKRWLGDLFILQRREFNKNMILIKTKSNEISKLGYEYNPKRIHYFSGFALTQNEIDYIEFEESFNCSEFHIQKMINICKEVYKNSKKKEMKLKQRLNDISEYRKILIYNCIKHPGIVADSLIQRERMA